MIRNDLRADTEVELHARASLVADLIEGLPPGLLEGDDVQRRVERMGADSGTRITVIGPDGRVLLDSHERPDRMENHGAREEVAGALRDGYASAVRWSHTLGDTLMYAA